MGIDRRRRNGLGMVGIVLLLAALVLAVSMISTGFRGLGFGADSGFLHRPGAAETSSPPASAATSTEPAPSAPVGGDLAPLRDAVDEATRGLERALASGDPAAIATARDELTRAQAELKAGLSR